MVADREQAAHQRGGVRATYASDVASSATMRLQCGGHTVTPVTAEQLTFCTRSAVTPLSSPEYSAVTSVYQGSSCWPWARRQAPSSSVCVPQSAHKVTAQR